MSSEFRFGIAEPFDAVRELIPPRLLALAAKGPALLGIDSGTVAAVGFAHLAAASGRLAFLDDGTVKIPSPFNLAVVADNNLPGNWLVTMGRSWTDYALSFRTLNPPTVQAALQNYLRDAARPSAQGKTSDPQMNELMQRVPETALNLLRTQFIATKVDPADVIRTLAHSRDSCAVLINGAADPLFEWAHLSPAKQRQLAEMLILSWQCNLLPIAPGGGGISATLCALFLTNCKNLKRAFFNPDTQEEYLPPILFFRQTGSPKRFPDIGSPEIQEWWQVLKLVFTHRLSQKDAPEIGIESGAKKIAEEFFSGFATALCLVPAAMHPWLRWLPELVLRLYHILMMIPQFEYALRAYGEGEAYQQQPVMSGQQKQAIMLNAVRLTRWLMHEHYQVVQECVDSSSAAHSADAADNADTKEAAEAIFDRLRDKGPLLPRDLQRSFSNLTAELRDRAIRLLKSEGRVTELHDKRLALVT